ncbi:MAG: AAC(3) family N-acetyltransferase [Chloroflexi bacterium]|nr:AAC(3) family N-acetyltransferase [Chloroflexota bacterium]
MDIYRDLVTALRKLDLDGSRPAIVHTSLSAFGQITGGVQAVLGALFEHFESLIVPTFTYKTMLVPAVGPPNNAIEYGQRLDANAMAEMFSPGLPADRLIGIIPETLRRSPRAQRTGHPILSFAGINATEILCAQTFGEPFMPIAELIKRDGWALLMGVDQTANTSIHWAERLAGRKTFLRWALTKELVRECAHFPPCSDGFNALKSMLAPIERRTRVGTAAVSAYPVKALVRIAQTQIEKDPLALLCTRSGCPRCDAVRKKVAQSQVTQRIYADAVVGN